MVCAHIGTHNGTADYYYNGTEDYYGMHCFACVYKDLKAWVTHELLRMCAHVTDRAYQVVAFGRCQPGHEIKSISECTAAAKFVGAPVTSVFSDGLKGSQSYPPFCYYSNGEVKFNAGNNKGYCSYQKLVICLCLAEPTATTTTTPQFTKSYSGAFPWRDG